MATLGTYAREMSPFEPTCRLEGFQCVDSNCEREIESKRIAGSEVNVVGAAVLARFRAMASLLSTHPGSAVRSRFAAIRIILTGLNTQNRAEAGGSGKCRLHLDLRSPIVHYTGKRSTIHALRRRNEDNCPDIPRHVTLDPHYIADLSTLPTPNPLSNGNSAPGNCLGFRRWYCFCFRSGGCR